jgi:hypothetical protein
MIDYSILREYYKTTKFGKKIKQNMNNQELNDHCEWYWKGSVSEAERNGTIKEMTEKEYVENAKRQLPEFAKKVNQIFKEDKDISKRL